MRLAGPHVGTGPASWMLDTVNHAVTRVIVYSALSCRTRVNTYTFVYGHFADRWWFRRVGNKIDKQSHEGDCEAWNLWIGLSYETIKKNLTRLQFAAGKNNEHCVFVLVLQRHLPTTDRTPTSPDKQ